MQIPKSGEFYRHFKGNLYQIVTVAEHTEDGQKLVIYQALYGDFKIYARPLEMFLSEVDHKKYPMAVQKYRFEKIELQTSEKVEAVIHSTEQSEEIISKITLEKEIMTDVEQNSAKKQVGMELEETDEMIAADSEADEGMVEPGFLAFLDEDDWDEKYNILISLRDKMTDMLINNFAVVLDVEIPDGPIEKRFEQLKMCVRTRQKYESQHLR